MDPCASADRPLVNLTLHKLGGQLVPEWPQILHGVLKTLLL